MTKHDSILIPLIAIIIMIQIIVFLFNLRKIWMYKKAIGNVKNFNIVHAFVQESDISEISIKEVFKKSSEEKYSINNMDEISTETIPDEEIQENYNPEDLTNSNDEFNFPLNEEDYNAEDKNEI